MSDNRKPYLGTRAKQSERTPYLGNRKAQTTRTPYLGGSSKQAAPREHKHHGFFATLKHVVTQTPKDLANAAYHAPGGIVAAAEAPLNAMYQEVRHGPHSKQAEEARKSEHGLYRAAVKQTEETVKHPLRHPGDTLLLALPVAGRVAKIGEAGSLARGGASAGEVVKAATVGVKPGPRVLRIGETEVRGHYSRAAGARVAQKATDKALQRGAAGSQRVENALHRRAAKWEGRNQRTADAVARAPGTAVSVLGQKLKPHELRAIRLVAEETPVERRLGAQEMRKGRATNAKEIKRHQERIDLTRAAMEHLTTDATGKPAFKPEATKLKAVYAAVQKASSDREGILKNLDLMDEASLQAAKTKVARVAAGATVQKVAPQSGRAAHVREYPATQRFKDLEAVRAKHPNAEIAASAGEHGITLSMIRTTDKARGTGAASKALDDLLHYADATGKKVALTPDPVGKGGLTKAQLAKWYASRGFVGNSGKNKDFAFRETMIRYPQALPARRVNVRAVEPRAAGHDLVGHEDIVASPNAVHIGNPAEKTKLRGAPKVSSTGTIGHTQKPTSLKVSTGGSVEHALERNDVTNIVSERHAEAVRLGKLDRVVQKFKGAGEKSPRRKDDVFMWTNKIVSNERIPKEVREYLDNPDSIAALSPDERTSIYDKIREATFEKQDWRDAEKVSEFTKLAEQGKGVFVPRKLLGEFAKPNYKLGDNAGVKFVDAVNNAQKVGLIYLKVNYPVVQGVSNAAMNIIHQGFAYPRNVTAAIRLENKVGPEYAAITDDIMGQGAILQAQLEGHGVVARASHKIADTMSSKVDRPARRAAFYHEALKAGFKTPEQYRALLTDDAHAGDLGEVAQRAREAIVDYGDMGPVERNIVRRLVFVYPWQKGATKYAGHFLRDHPVQAAALAQAGEVGKQQSDEAFGAVPSYLNGIIPVGGKAVNPAGVNFFQTPAQIGTAVAGLATGNPAQSSAGLGFLAPAPGIAAGLLSGRDDIGRPLTGNLAAKVRDLTVAQFPAAAAARAVAPSLPGPLPSVAKALAGSQGASKTFPNPNDPYWRFLFGGLYPRKVSRAALNQNHAREKTGR